MSRALAAVYCALMAGCMYVWGLSACARPPAPAATPKPISMGDKLVCFYARAEQKGETLVCGESRIMCEAIRAEEYDKGSEVGPCTVAAVALTVKKE